MGVMGRFRTIQVKLIIIYVLLILVAMQLIGVYFVRTLENTFESNFTTSLTNQANLIAEYVKPYLVNRATAENGDTAPLVDNLDEIVNNFNRFSGAEIQIIDDKGIVLSSSLDQTVVGQKNTQAEVSRVLQGIHPEPEDVVDEHGVRKRAIVNPIVSEGRIIGAIYMVASMEDQYEMMDGINRIFIAGTLIALALTALLGIILSGTITAPIKEITRTATEMAEGNFNASVKVKGSDEIGQLAQAFNYMTNRLKEALNANEEEKEKLASILSNMSDGVIATDEQGRVIVLNRRAKDMLRLEEQEAMGRQIADLLSIPKQQVDAHVLGADHTAVIEFADRRDEPILVRATFTPIHRRGQGITGTIIVLHDVTEQEQLERSRREFVANVSHELRTPLTTINSYLEALNDGALDDPELARNFLGVTRNETERMIRLVNDLLQLSRLDSGQTALRREPVDLAAMLEDVADRFSFQLRKRKIGISIQTDRRLPAVSADPDQLDQVLDNLVSNAIKYTPEGGAIEIIASRSGHDKVEVAVKDTGIGIPEKDLSRIFERFYRVDKARSRSMGGTGLGLSIAREIVKAHGGDIRIDSVVNQGTTVTFSLPLSDAGGEVR